MVHLFSAVIDRRELREREAYLATLELPGTRVARSVVIADDVADEIHEAYHELGEPVVCMATRARGRSVAVVGSVATEFVARGHPVVLVGPLVGETPLWPRR
jgi:hypothetical protein